MVVVKVASSKGKGCCFERIIIIYPPFVLLLSSEEGKRTQKKVVSKVVRVSFFSAKVLKCLLKKSLNTYNNKTFWVVHTKKDQKKREGEREREREKKDTLLKP